MLSFLNFFLLERKKFPNSDLCQASPVKVLKWTETQTEVTASMQLWKKL